MHHKPSKLAGSSNIPSFCVLPKEHVKAPWLHVIKRDPQASKAQPLSKNLYPSTLKNWDSSIMFYHPVVDNDNIMLAPA